MILAFSAETRRRLADIEMVEGIPALDLIHQAVDVWCQLSAEERQTLGICAMQLVVGRLRGGQLG